MTAAELFALPDNDRLDRRLIHGQLVERPYPFRPPAHAAVVANLWGLLGNWERSPDGAGWVAYGYGCPYRLHADPDTLVYFDASVIPASLDDITPARAGYINGTPTIAIEVIDQSDPEDAIRELREVAWDFGIRLLWLIDPYEEYVELHRPRHNTALLGKSDDLVGGCVGPPLRFPVSALFE